MRIAPSITWEHLVLPPRRIKVLREIAIEVTRRSKARRPGVGALFIGNDGRAKTLAAEVLASQLGADLYRIDLSTVVSKYIGETEKNLRLLFAAAEQGGCILFFDEADALFGKRSDVKDSHDRYAHSEVGYLLRQIESYPGLAILTASSKRDLDDPFLRRLRYVVQFQKTSRTGKAKAR